jgi:hypothetical protein
MSSSTPPSASASSYDGNGNNATASVDSLGSWASIGAPSSYVLDENNSNYAKPPLSLVSLQASSLSSADAAATSNASTTSRNFNDAAPFIANNNTTMVNNNTDNNNNNNNNNNSFGDDAAPFIANDNVAMVNDSNAGVVVVASSSVFPSYATMLKLAMSTLAGVLLTAAYYRGSRRRLVHRLHRADRLSSTLLPLLKLLLRACDGRSIVVLN